MKKTTLELYTEYERLYKEMESAYNIWAQYDENDPFSKEARRARKTWERAEARKREAFDAWLKAEKEQGHEHHD